jgi:lambda repressor-like predicted transcriptional regulator
LGKFLSVRVNEINPLIYSKVYDKMHDEVIGMTIEQKISMALAYKGMSQAALAREIGTSPANLNQRMKRGSFTAEEMEKIAAALGAKYFYGFEFDDGTKV